MNLKTANFITILRNGIFKKMKSITHIILTIGSVSSAKKQMEQNKKKIHTLENINLLIELKFLI